MQQSGITFLLAFFLFNLGTVDATWSIAHRGTFPMHLRDAAWSPDGTRIVVAGPGGAIIRSTDSGTTWQLGSSSTSKDLNSVDWQNNSTVWMAAGNSSGWNSSGALVRSTDSGVTWTTVIDNHPVRLTRICFIDSLHGWAGKPDNAFLRTTDGGNSWTDIDISETDVSTASLFFIDELLGYTTESVFGFSLYRTTDGGATWDDVYSDSLGSIVGTVFPTSTIGRLASVKQVAGSSNGGTSWTPLAQQTNAWLYGIDFKDASTGWITGRHDVIENYDPLIRKTTDGGTSWADQTVAGATILSGVRATSVTDLIAWGSFGYLYSTSDGGASWNLIPSVTAEHFHDIQMIDGLNGWAVGEPSAIRRTTDGGTTWNQVTQVWENNGLNLVYDVDGSTIYAAGTSIFLLSTDGGDSWTRRSEVVPYASGIHFSDAMTGWVGGRYGIYYTTDAGMSWEIQAGMGYGGVYDLEFIDDDTAFAVAGLSTIFQSFDNGLSWVTAYSHGINNYLRALFFVDSQHGWAVGESYPTDEAIILATTNGGANWVAQDSNVNAVLYDVFFWNPSVGMAVGEGGLILETTNGGTNWVVSTSPVSSTLYTIEPIGGGHVWLAGEWGTILTSNTTPVPTATPATPTLTPTITPTRTPTPRGDTCDFPIEILSLPYSDNGQTLTRNDDYDEICPWAATAPDVVYEYSPPGAQTIDVTLCTGVTDYNTKLYVYQDICPNTGNPMACNEDSCSNPPHYEFTSISRLTNLSLQAGHTYYIIVDGWSSHEGLYTINVTVAGMPTSTPSRTPTSTQTATYTATPNPTPTPTRTPTSTVPPTSSPTGTRTPTATSTITAGPSNTPQPTATQSMTPSDTPTRTPTGTASFTPEPTFTPTEAPSPTTEPTGSPTVEPTESPTAIPPLGVRIELPTLTVHPNETFYVKGYLDNPNASMANVPVFFVLDVYGSYWFWPSWSLYSPPTNPNFDYDILDIPTGTTIIDVISAFTWPDTGADSVSGIYFYGAMLDSGMTGLRGQMAAVSWGYGP